MVVFIDAILFCNSAVLENTSEKCLAEEQTLLKDLKILTHADHM